MSQKKISLRDVPPDGFAAMAESLGQKPYRAKQMIEWVYRHCIESIEEMTNLPKELRAALAEKYFIPNLQIMDTLSSHDGTTKYLFLLDDGNTIETVMIPDSDRRTACISTQAGCKLGCVFCKTGNQGFLRDLTGGEILSQAFAMKKLHDVTNYVFMGMGEPLDNMPGLMHALSVMTDNALFAAAARKITVSTAGVVPGITELGRAGYKISLAVSLNATTDEVRSKLMPINKKYPINELMTACRAYPLGKGRKITFEYVLIAGLNDSDADARRLASLLRSIPHKVNLIPLNPGAETGDYKAPAMPVVDRFHKLLVDLGVRVFTRKSKGADILAACGQLRSRNLAHEARQAR